MALSSQNLPNMPHLTNSLGLKIHLHTSRPFVFLHSLFHSVCGGWRRLCGQLLLSSINKMISYM